MSTKVREWGFGALLLVSIVVVASPLWTDHGSTVAWPLLLTLLVALGVSAFPLWLPLIVGPPLQWQQPHQVVTPTVRSGEALRYRTVIRARWGGSYATPGTQWLGRLDLPTLRSRFTRGLEGRNLPTGTQAWRSVEVTLTVPEDVAPGRYRLRSNFAITDTLLGQP